MKHTVDDGPGRREVWLDGMLLNGVFECDDEQATACVRCEPIRVVDDRIATEEWFGLTLVVQPIGAIQFD